MVHCRSENTLDHLSLSFFTIILKQGFLNFVAYQNFLESIEKMRFLAIFPRLSYSAGLVFRNLCLWKVLIYSDMWPRVKSTAFSLTHTSLTRVLVASSLRQNLPGKECITSYPEDHGFFAFYVNFHLVSVTTPLVKFLKSHLVEIYKFSPYPSKEGKQWKIFIWVD